MTTKKSPSKPPFDSIVVPAGLEADIDEHPLQPDAYLVLADWLLEHGDARGELIVRQQKEPRKANARLLDGETKIGPDRPRYGDYRWFCGFVSWMKTRIDSDDEEWLRQYLAHPSLRHVVEIEMDVPGTEDEDRQFAIDILADREVRCELCASERIGEGETILRRVIWIWKRCGRSRRASSTSRSVRARSRPATCAHCQARCASLLWRPRRRDARHDRGCRSTKGRAAFV